MKKLFLLLTALFSCLSLSAGWGADLCEDVTCSGHGECHDDGEDEWCVCDEGYIADDLDCILGCNGVTCSGHGTCSVVSGAEICTCEAGFYATGLNCILNEASTVDTLAILNSTDCYNTGNCHYRLIFATGAYSFTPSNASLYDIIVNVLDSENVWHNYRKTVAQCVTEGVCDNVDAQYIDFWFQHEVNGNQYITVEVLGNGDDAYDDMSHDVLIDYCYGVDCGTGGTCDDSLGYPVCSCEYGYVLRGGVCEEGWFEDENLAAAVVELLQFKGYEVETETDIEPEMLEDITALPLKNKNISSLAGIGLFSSLGILDISGNNISDLSPLADCSGLKVLNISGNPANDLGPLSTLPLSSIDISYSGVYNLNPLVSVTSLQEIVLADTADGRHGIVRPENTNVAAWLEVLELSGCNELSLYYPGDGRIGEIKINAGCSVHGSCVLGQCVCDEGYVWSNKINTCSTPMNCGENSHPSLDSVLCLPNRDKIKCDDGDPGKIFPDSYLEWDGKDYAYPSGFTNQELCLIEDPNCDAVGAQSLCRWRCGEGYKLAEDRSGCVPFAEREISVSAYNQLIIPNISRQDVVLEPVPGVPSFAPVFRAETFYGSSDTGWYFNLPRAELDMLQECTLICASDCGKICTKRKSRNVVHLYMPWGHEEYSIIVAKRCYNSNKTNVSCSSSDAAGMKVTYYPAPGQNVFSYIVVDTTEEAYDYFSLESAGKYFNIPANREKDRWTITRYGEDGSVTEFFRGEDNNYATRPAFYDFMDYIPISKYTTRDGKETAFEYEWDSVDLSYNKYSHYNLRSATIIDPLKRVVKIESDSTDSGLMGRPDPEYQVLYKPLEGNIEISVGKFDDNKNPVEPLRKVVEYKFYGGFAMEADIYDESETLYRSDSYSKDQKNIYLLQSNSYSQNQQPDGETIWDFSSISGYTEKKLVSRGDQNNSEYIVKKVTGSFRPQYQSRQTETYSLVLSPYHATTVYGIEKNGQTTNERIVEDYLTNWAQPAKRVTCPYNSTEKCNLNSSATTTEEIRYNVSGSPIYFRNADGQVTLNIYDTTAETNAENYNFHFHADPHTYINFDQTIPDLDLNFVRADNLRKTGTQVCSALYSLDTQAVSIDGILSDYVSGIILNSALCSNTENRKVTNYEFQREDWGKPYDLQSVTYPDGKVRTFTYDYEISSFLQNSQIHANYIPNGKIWGESITGSNNQNTLQTCYAYNGNYQLVAQGIGAATNCGYKKGFLFDSDSGLLMTRDFSYNGNTETLSNDYIYDSMGRKIAERNSAGVSTVYVYDSLDRVVFTFFGCKLGNNNSVAFGRIYGPYDFDGDDSAGDDGRGVTFQSDFPYNDFSCEYYRKYKYDEMSNLVETDFFEYWGVNADNQVEPLSTPKKIRQFTEYDKIGRAIKSCHFDVAQPSDKRCIETEHDIFGNIVKKEEAVYDQNDLKRNDVQGEVREITYDPRNRPLTVTVDGLPTEEYSYNDENCDTYCDKISNKYGKTLTTYKDRWNRAAKQVDPFGNETVTTYESDYSDNITSQITTSSNVKTGETVWTYDDLDRKLSETRKQFIPGSESTTNVNHVTWWEYDTIGNVASVESSDGTKQSYSYDTLNRPVETINYEKINSNWVETSSSENSYDTTGRLFRTEMTRNSQTITEDYGFDTFGRVTSVKTTDSSTQNQQTRYRVKFYNTGGQVIWEADEESDGTSNNFNTLNILNVEVGNQKYYTYNAFGDLEKTVYVMTDSGIGNDENLDLNPWLNNGQITTNFEYDIFGRITSRTNDRSGITQYNYYQNNTTGSHRRNKLESIQIFPAPDDGDTDYADPGSVAQTYTYTYDAKGDEASVEYREGNSYSMLVSFARDNYGRIISKASNGSVPVTQTFTYNNRNLLETATDTVGNAAATSVTRFYDSFGNPYSEAVSANNVTKTVSRRMTDAKTYQFTYPDGKTLRKTATGSDLDSIEYNNSEIASYSRANGVLTAVTKGQNLTETFSYNTWNQLANHTISNAPNSDIYDMTYNYSRGWHLTEKADGIKNTSDKYTYDSYYRLKEVKYDFVNNAATRTDNFYQDGVHNIEQSTENGVTYAWGVDKLNRLRDKKVGGNTAVTYKYDKRNNMIGEDFDGSNPVDISYIYDDLNRLIEVKDGSNNTIATYTYDAFNRRITKTVGSTTERYSYDDWDIVEIATNSNNYTNIIDSGTDRHIAIEVTSNNVSTLYYFLTDERGNVTALTDVNGNVLERYRYRVYGDFEILDSQFAPKNCNNQTCYATNLHNFLWGGSLYEPETNLYWMRNRYYHIDMHRFINQDPIGIWGDANNLGNGFAYVAGMVIEASDPTGLEYDVWTRNSDGTTSGYYASYANRDAAATISQATSILASLYGFVTSFALQAGTPILLRFVSTEGLDLAMQLIPDSTRIGLNHLESTFGKESAEIIISIGMQLSESVGAKGFHYKDNGDGTVDLTAVGKDGKETKKTINLEEEKNKREEERLKNLDPDEDECPNDIESPDERGVDPDSGEDMFQRHLRSKMLKMRLKIDDNSNQDKPLIVIETDTPIGKTKMVVRNPYYKNIDPLKRLMKGQDPNSRTLIFNPFLPPESTEYRNTYERITQGGKIVMPNVDPYLW